MNDKTDVCVSGRPRRLSATVALVSLGLTGVARAEKVNGWPLIFKDDFDRQVVSPRWLIHCADGNVYIQKAIDSLPPTGGVVILPKGTLLLRRHLRLRSNVSLRGQGAGKTILKAASQFRCKVKTLDVGDGTCTVTLEPRDAKLFRVGDGVCFGEKWTNPVFDTEQNADCVVTAIKGNILTVRGTPTEKAVGSKLLCHFFPLVYARRAEFVEVKDLSLQGADEPRGVWGSFEVAPATFGLTIGVRFSRVDVLGWRGDGLSLQGASDAIITDNTAMNNNQAFSGHAGIRLGAGSTGCQVLYNNCNDEQTHPTQGRGIVEEKGAGGNTIRFNIAATMARAHIDRAAKKLAIHGRASIVEDNLGLSLVFRGSSERPRGRSAQLGSAK